MAKEPFLINPPLRHSRLGLKRKRVLRDNPLGEEILILGLNPKKSKRRRSGMLNNSWFGHHAEHRAAALKGWRGRRRKKVGITKRGKKVTAKSRSAAARKAWRTRRAKGKGKPVTSTFGMYRPGRMAMNPPRKRKRASRKMHDNAPRRRARRMRHNPIYDNRIVRRRGRGRFRHNPVGGSFMKQTMAALPHVGVGAVSVITTALVPKFTAKISTSQYASLGGQLVWVFGGGYMVNKFTKNKYGLAWIVGGGSVILADLVHKYILGGVLAGLGAYEPATVGYTTPTDMISGVGAYEPARLGAAAPGFAPATGFESVAGFGDFGLADADYRG